MHEIGAKHILTPYGENNMWFGLNYNMNIYRGCCHGCIYCDSRSACYNVENFDEVRIKKDALAVLERDLRSFARKGVIGTGSMTDHYNPFEKDLRITRGALELIDKYGFGINITTKSDIVARDKDILLKISGHSPSSVTFTVTTINEKLCKKIEPNAPTAAARLAALKKLTDLEIVCGVILTPILPFINDTEDNISGILEEAARAGAKYAFTFHGFGVTLRQNQRDYFFDKLDALFPGTKRKYIHAFGNAYSCSSPNNAVLKKIFTERCRALGLKCEMNDIVALMRERYGSQMSMF